MHCNLVKHVNVERQSTRFCPNLHEHAHFHDEASGRVYDVDLDPRTLAKLKSILPPGYDGRAALPLVLDLHGSGGNSGGQARTSGLETLAAREGFAVATLDAVDAGGIVGS